MNRAPPILAGSLLGRVVSIEIVLGDSCVSVVADVVQVEEKTILTLYGHGRPARRHNRNYCVQAGVVWVNDAKVPIKVIWHVVQR